MNFYETSEINRRIMDIRAFIEMKSDFGRADVVQELYQRLLNDLCAYSQEFERLGSEQSVISKEPEELDVIRNQAPNFDDSMFFEVDSASIRNKISGAVMGRFIGCLLGIPVEGWKMRDIEGFARQLGIKYPPSDYWTDIYWPEWVAEGKDLRKKYIKSELTCVRVDDDITYTLLNLLIMERYGFNVTTEDIGDFWKKHLPKAHTAEKVALKNLKAGYCGKDAAVHNNPYLNWIGASIRSDIWAWVYPGQPGKAAELAWRDGMLTHRSSGLYGEMFYSAMQATAFALTDIEIIIKVGLQFIPDNCRLAEDINWAIGRVKSIKDWREINSAIKERFHNQSHVHMNCNACLVVMSLLYGGGDFELTLGIVTALGYDTDCNAASVGSILGALCGENQIAEKWKAPFSGPILSNIVGFESFRFQDVVNRVYVLSEEGRGRYEALQFRQFWKDIITDEELKKNIERTLDRQLVILEKEKLSESVQKYNKPVKIVLSDRTSLEAAAFYHGKSKSIALLNFASGTTPGGGARFSHYGQEEGLCHCTTLYPCLNSEEPLRLFYTPHRERNHIIQTNDIIYSPGVTVLRLDPTTRVELSTKMYEINVISCAAPNFREKVNKQRQSKKGNLLEDVGISREEYRSIFQKRFERIMHVGATYDNQVLILGAFGCGAYKNDPVVVAQALMQAIKTHQYSFDTIEIAVPHSEPGRNVDNHEIFKKVFGSELTNCSIIKNYRE